MKKTNLFGKIGKTLVIAFLSIGLVTFLACNPDPEPEPTPTPTPTPTPDPDPDPDPTNVDQWHNLVNETPHEVQLEDNTLTYGNHVYTMTGEIDYHATVYNQPTATVTFTNVPSGYTEFEAVYNNLLGTTPWGTAAMIPMAIEIFARDMETGERCFNLLCNGSATVSEIIRILRTKLIPSQYSPQDDQYIQRYMAAALLKGAVNTNAYTPDEPYTVEMCCGTNHVQDAPLTGGTVYYNFILAHGWDTFQRSVEIFQPYGGGYYKVFNCPACYTQCKNIIGTWQGLK